MNAGEHQAEMARQQDRRVRRFLKENEVYDTTTNRRLTSSRDLQVATGTEGSATESTAYMTG